MFKLYKFHLDYGRMGCIEGTFVCTEDALQILIGKELQFGEVLGKHSDVNAVLRESDLIHLTDDWGFIEKAMEYGLVPCGYNPFDYLPKDVEDVIKNDS
jgi:hypothetical protein